MIYRYSHFRKKSQKKIPKISNFFEILRFENFENLGRKNCHLHKMFVIRPNVNILSSIFFCKIQYFDFPLPICHHLFVFCSPYIQINKCKLLCKLLQNCLINLSYLEIFSRIDWSKLLHMIK